LRQRLRFAKSNKFSWRLSFDLVAQNDQTSIKNVLTHFAMRAPAAVNPPGDCFGCVTQDFSHIIGPKTEHEHETHRVMKFIAIVRIVGAHQAFKVRKRSTIEQDVTSFFTGNSQ